MRIKNFIKKYSACLSTLLIIIFCIFAIIISAKAYADLHSPGCDCEYVPCPHTIPPDYILMCSTIAIGCRCITREYSFCFYDKKGKCIGSTSDGCGGTRTCRESDCNKDMSGCGSDYGCPPKNCGICIKYTAERCPNGDPYLNDCNVKCQYNSTYYED